MDEGIKKVPVSVLHVCFYAFCMGFLRKGGGGFRQGVLTIYVLLKPRGPKHKL